MLREYVNETHLVFHMMSVREEVLCQKQGEILHDIPSMQNLKK